MILAGAEARSLGSSRQVNKKCAKWLTPICVSSPSSVSCLGHAMIPEGRTTRHYFDSWR